METKRGSYRKAEPIETDELCCYGCGKTARFKSVAGKLMCGKSVNSCSVSKQKNSEGIKNGRSHLTEAEVTKLYQARYDAIPEESKDRMNWNKGNRHAEFGKPGKGQFKNALLAERGHRCECCGLSEWMGQPITIELEHIDGDNKNNTRENLKLLCPNCHSQTSTWRRAKRPGKNKKKHSDQEILDAVRTSENLHQALVKLDLRWGSGGTILRVMSEHQVSFKE